MTAQETGNRWARLSEAGGEVFDWLVYRMTWLFASLAGIFYIRLRVSGVSCFPLDGPVLLVSNHQSFIDPLFLGLAMPRRAKFASRSTLIKGIVGRYFRALGAIPLNREGVSLSGLKTVLAALGRRDALVYFPEGTRTPDGEIGTLKKGVGLIIRRAKAQVVLCGIAGAYEAWPRHSPIPLPGTMWMHFRSWSIDEAASNSEDDLMQSLAVCLEEVKEEAYRRREAFLRQCEQPIELDVKNKVAISPEEAGSPLG